MLYSHHFNSVETMNRARYWLTWHGFTVQDSQLRSDPTRLAVRVTWTGAAALRTLIDSIDCGSPHGPAQAHDGEAAKLWRVDQPATTSLAAPHSTGTPIHWHSREEVSGNDSARVTEYMLSRWE